jgi:integrase
MTKRRVKGEGSVYQRRNGRYVGEYEDANGKRRYVSGKGKGDVSAKLRKALADREAGIALVESLTVGAFMDQWLGIVKDTVRLNSFKPYEAITRLHIKTTLGRTKLEKLTALQLQTLYHAKLKEGLSPRRVQYIHVTIHKALKDAERWDLVRKNVAGSVKPPKPVKAEITPLTQEQLRKLLETAKADKLYCLYVLAVTTAMRQGELLGLQWKGIDLEAGTLRVNRSVYNGAISPPKTTAGRRTIRLSKLGIAALKAHRTRQAQQRISEWVFSTSKGTPISCHNLHNRSWKPLLKKSGLPHTIRFHDLRHYCITLLLTGGVPVKVISEMAGHSDVSITLSVYQHVLPDMQGACADRIDEALG